MPPGHSPGPEALEPEVISTLTRAGSEPPTAGVSLRRPVRWGILAVALAALLAALFGYWNGSSQRAAAQRQITGQAAQEQFDLAVADLEAGRYEIARQRLEYLIRLDPSFPGAAERLVEALLALSPAIATPTPAATPTPDLSPVVDIFDRAVAAFAERDWTRAIDTLLAVRGKNPTFRAIEVDGMLYAALRNRGVERILAGDLEEGMYDLSLAERFGPLDRDAVSWRVSAGYYLLANSYFGVNWAQAVAYFSEVCLADIWDSCFKLGVSAQKYGDQFLLAGDFCTAMEQYDASLFAWPNGTLVPTATEAALECENSRRPPPPPATETPTPPGPPGGPPP